MPPQFDDILNFFVIGQIPHNVLPGAYNLHFVALSFVVVFLSSLTAMDFATRILRTSSKKESRKLLISGAITMGSGIWAMHFTGMPAFSLGIQMRYETWTTLIWPRKG